MSWVFWIVVLPFEIILELPEFVLVDPPEVDVDVVADATVLLELEVPLGPVPDDELDPVPEFEPEVDPPDPDDEEVDVDDDPFELFATGGAGGFAMYAFTSP